MYILASDFDNTLYFNGSFHQEDLEAIKRFQNTGHKFGICTGRQLNGITMPSIGYDISYDFYITCSGAMILDKHQHIIFEKTIPYHFVKEINQKINAWISISSDNKVYVCGTNKKLPKDLGTKINSLNDLKIKEVTDFNFHFKSSELKEAKLCCDYINTYYQDYMIAFQNNEHVDVAPVNCSKGNGLKFMEKYYMSQKTITIGDSWNDITMLDAASMAYCFNYSPKELKKKADMIVHSVNECINDILQ